MAQDTRNQRAALPLSILPRFRYVPVAIKICDVDVPDCVSTIRTFPDGVYVAPGATLGVAAVTMSIRLPSTKLLIAGGLLAPSHDVTADDGDTATVMSLAF